VHGTRFGIDNKIIDYYQLFVFCQNKLSHTKSINNGLIQPCFEASAACDLDNVLCIDPYKSEYEQEIPRQHPIRQVFPKVTEETKHDHNELWDHHQVSNKKVKDQRAVFRDTHDVRPGSNVESQQYMKIPKRISKLLTQAKSEELHLIYRIEQR